MGPRPLVPRGARRPGPSAGDLRGFAARHVHAVGLHPPRSGASEYMRNHLDLNDVERNARWPRQRGSRRSRPTPTTGNRGRCASRTGVGRPVSDVASTTQSEHTDRARDETRDAESESATDRPGSDHRADRAERCPTEERWQPRLVPPSCGALVAIEEFGGLAGGVRRRGHRWAVRLAFGIVHGANSARRAASECFRGGTVDANTPRTQQPTQTLGQHPSQSAVTSWSRPSCTS